MAAAWALWPCHSQVTFCASHQPLRFRDTHEHTHGVAFFDQLASRTSYASYRAGSCSFSSCRARVWGTLVYIGTWFITQFIPTWSHYTKASRPFSRSAVFFLRYFIKFLIWLRCRCTDWQHNGHSLIMKKYTCSIEVYRRSFKWQKKETKYTFTASARGIENPLKWTEVVFTKADQLPFVSVQLPSSPLSPPAFWHNANINVCGSLFATFFCFFCFFFNDKVAEISQEDEWWRSGQWKQTFRSRRDKPFPFRE